MVCYHLPDEEHSLSQSLNYNSHAHPLVSINASCCTSFPSLFQSLFIIRPPPVSRVITLSLRLPPSPWYLSTFPRDSSLVCPYYSFPGTFRLHLDTPSSLVILESYTRAQSTLSRTHTRRQVFGYGFFPDDLTFGLGYFPLSSEAVLLK